MDSECAKNEPTTAYIVCSGRKMCVKRKKKSMTAFDVCIRLYGWHSESESVFAVPTFCSLTSPFLCFAVVHRCERWYQCHSVCSKFIKNRAQKNERTKHKQSTAIKSYGFCFRGHLSTWLNVHATHLAFKVLHICENEILRWIAAQKRTCNESINGCECWSQYRIASVQLWWIQKIGWKLKVSNWHLRWLYFYGSFYSAKTVVCQTPRIPSIRCPLLFAAMRVPSCGWYRTAHKKRNANFNISMVKGVV